MDVARRYRTSLHTYYYFEQENVIYLISIHLMHVQTSSSLQG